MTSTRYSLLCFMPILFFFFFFFFLFTISFHFCFAFPFLPEEEAEAGSGLGGLILQFPTDVSWIHQIRFIHPRHVRVQILCSQVHTASCCIFLFVFKFTFLSPFDFFFFWKFPPSDAGTSLQSRYKKFGDPKKKRKKGGGTQNYVGPTFGGFATCNVKLRCRSAAEEPCRCWIARITLLLTLELRFY